MTADPIRRHQAITDPAVPGHWITAKLTPKQAGYIGVPVEGPYKPDYYRY